MANIGEPVKEVEFEPFPLEAPVEAPAPAPTPVPTPVEEPSPV
jgi:hypothetical protein